MKYDKDLYLEYNSLITKELYNLLINELIEQGFKYYIHCRLSGENHYEDFKRERYLHINIGKDNAYMNQGVKIFTIDNNRQCVKHELSLDYVLDLPKKQVNYEIY